MANKKFSEFDLKTSSSDVAFVVGFNGSDNVRITPNNLRVAGGADTEIQFNNSGALGGGSFLTTNKSNKLEVTYELGLKGDGGSNQGLLKLYCEAGTAHHVGIKGPAHSGGSSYTLQLPNTLPNVANQVLESNAAGTLSWIATPSGAGGVTSIIAGSGISVNQATGAVTVSASGGGGGASDLNGLSDCLVDTLSLYVGESPSSLSGNPQGNATLGIDSGNALTTGDSNTLIGSEAGLLLTTQRLNTYVGARAGAGQIGSSNTALGWRALESTTAGNRDGQRNVAIGMGAFRYGIIGERNTALGFYASFSTILSGDNNTVIGNSANTSTSSVSNEITLGNSSITSLRCAVTSITSLSDERDKSDIKDLEYGLAFIDALQPREFVWDNRAETRKEVDEDGNETEVEFYSANKGKKDFGFIAQEVRELDNDTLRLVYTENEDKLELSYGKLVPILVKAIQELKEEVELLKS